MIPNRREAPLGEWTSTQLLFRDRLRIGCKWIVSGLIKAETGCSMLPSDANRNQSVLAKDCGCRFPVKVEVALVVKREAHVLVHGHALVPNLDAFNIANTPTAAAITIHTARCFRHGMLKLKYCDPQLIETNRWRRRLAAEKR